MNRREQINLICKQFYPGDAVFDRWQRAANYPIPKTQRVDLRRQAAKIRRQLEDMPDEAVEKVYEQRNGLELFFKKAASDTYWDEHEATNIIAGNNDSSYANDKWLDRKTNKGYQTRYDRVRRSISRAIDGGQLPQQIKPKDLLSWSAKRRLTDPELALSTLLEWAILENLSQQDTGVKSNVVDQNTNTDQQPSTNSAIAKKLTSAEKLAIGLTYGAFKAAEGTDCSDDIGEVIGKFGLPHVSELIIAALQQCQAEHLEKIFYPLNDSKSSADSQWQTLVARKKLTILQQVAGILAIKFYSYVPQKKRQKSINDVVSDLNLAGISLDADTVRKHLQSGTQKLDQLKQ